MGINTFRSHIILVITALFGCADLPSTASTGNTGPNPELPIPRTSLIPTVNIAPAIGWPQGLLPVSAPGTQVKLFATGLDHPRWLYTLPNGDILVAETNAPPKPEDGKGIKGWLMGLVMKKAGATPPSANRITLLRPNASGDGVMLRSIFLNHLNSPFGMALIGGTLYVANTDAVVKFAYLSGTTQILGAGTLVARLPGGPINHHWTKNIIASKDGRKLYATVGSNSNIGERGIAAENERAAIWEIDVATGAHRVFASGLRNPNGLAWEPDSGALWTVVNERDELGNDLVPDYLTSVKDSAFYGWPYSYYGQHLDSRVKPPREDLVAKAISPDFALGAHVAALGLAATDGASTSPKALPFGKGMFIGEHGSWNRKPLSGYKVVFVPFQNGQPSGPPTDVLTGFVSPQQKAYGRPVGVVLDNKCALLVADDVGNVIWRVRGL